MKNFLLIYPALCILSKSITRDGLLLISLPPAFNNLSQGIPEASLLFSKTFLTSLLAFDALANFLAL